MTDLDRFTETELNAMHADAYQRALTHFETADLLLGKMSGLPYPSAAYSDTHARERAAMAAGTEAHELLRAIRAELDTRRSTHA